jgi:hypothetical protein
LQKALELHTFQPGMPSDQWMRLYSPYRAAYRRLLDSRSKCYTARTIDKNRERVERCRKSLDDGCSNWTPDNAAPQQAIHVVVVKL